MKLRVLIPGGALWFGLGVICLGLSNCGPRASGPVGAPQDIGQSEWHRAEEHGGDPRARVPGAHTTIARCMPQFKRCFERLEATGKLSLVITVGPEGQVRGAHASGRVPREVAHCVESAVMATQFSPPEGRRLARLDVPVAVYDQ